MKDVLDLVGNKLSVGDRVVYSTKGYGRSVNMLHGEITEITPAQRIGDYHRVDIKPLVAGRKAVWKYALDICTIKVPE